MGVSSLRILGLDPGLRNTGWGVIDVHGNSLKYVAHGVIHSKAEDTLPSRLSQLFQGLKGIIHTWQPHEASVEETFVNMNAASTLKLGMARGIVLLAPADAGLPVGEYSANRIKKSIVGAGHAEKSQVAHMVQLLLAGCGPVSADGADALAAAICHAHFRNYPV